MLRRSVYQRANRSNYFARLLDSKAFLVLGAVVFILICISLIKVWSRHRQIANEVSSLQDQIAKIENNNKELADLLNYFDSNEFVEKEARSKMNLQKPGEKVVIISDQGNFLPNQAGSTATQDLIGANGQRVATAGNSEKWWNYFFK